LPGGGYMAEIAGSACNIIISSKFGREDEREADILGTRRLALAGVNPEAIAEFFAGFPADDAGKKRYGYLDSHPALQERQDYVRREADRFPGPFTPALGASKWRVLKAHAAKQGAGGETPRKSARGRQL
ncbi:MAG: M48 family metalloprotease, partial [Deltaproteobacteria bacterium]|nr:M48 family metalloprotease [Deltaproteobacteria bacterium]